MQIVRYKKSNRLGLTNNFIEYDANSDIPMSYFEGIRDESEESFDDENETKDTGRTEPESSKSEQDSLWILARRELLKGGIEKDYAAKLKEAYTKGGGKESNFGKAFKKLIDAKVADKPAIIKEIQEIYEKENKCPA